MSSLFRPSVLRLTTDFLVWSYRAIRSNLASSVEQTSSEKKMPTYEKNGLLAMRVQAAAGSKVEKRYQNVGAATSSFRKGKAIAPGLSPSPIDDLVYRGGKVVAQMGFRNVFLGGDAVWDVVDTGNIDAACKRMMQDRKLNNVMRQYFPGKNLSCDIKSSFILEEAASARIDEPAVKEMVVRMFDSGLLGQSDLEATVHNLILPRGVELRLDGDSSFDGLGGYHGSVHITRNQRRLTLYYSANVYSRRGTSNERQNGIPAFDAPWKSVVGTLYHEMQEFRTDPDVGDAIASNNDEFLGWTSLRGHEIGDQPIAEAPSLNLVFKEVMAGTPRQSTPVQFMYSNAVHGAEGPIARPHA
jgi:hypothetical protein